jgi:hypothetical protein
MSVPTLSQWRSDLTPCLVYALEVDYIKQFSAQCRAICKNGKQCRKTAGFYNKDGRWFLYSSQFTENIAIIEEGVYKLHRIIKWIKPMYCHIHDAKYNHYVPRDDYTFFFGSKSRDFMIQKCVEICEEYIQRFRTHPTIYDVVLKPKPKLDINNSSITTWRPRKIEIGQGPPIFFPKDIWVESIRKIISNAEEYMVKYVEGGRDIASIVLSFF